MFPKTDSNWSVLFHFVFIRKISSSEDTYTFRRIFYNHWLLPNQRTIKYELLTAKKIILPLLTTLFPIQSFGMEGAYFYKQLVAFVSNIPEGTSPSKSSSCSLDPLFSHITKNLSSYRNSQRLGRRSRNHDSRVFSRIEPSHIYDTLWKHLCVSTFRWYVCD